jgi:thiol-disulfide isomerase/thioredoxin
MSLVRKTMAQRFNQCLRAVGSILVTLVVVPLALAQEPPKNFIMHEGPEARAAVRFEDSQGQPRSLADFRGKVVLLNIWATWCVPCRREIPALDHLGAALNGADFAIVAVSIDRKGIDAVRSLFAELDVRRLAIYVDSSGQAARAVRAPGLPISLVIDRDGREVGRVIGPAEWDDGATIDFLRGVISHASQSDHARIDSGR